MWTREKWKTRKKHRHKFTRRVYLQRLAHHRQSSGGSKSYSNVGSTILPRDINCGFHIASMKHIETPWSKTHPDQAWSAHKLKCALRRILSIGGEIKCLLDVNLHESSHGISALQHLHEILNSPQKQKKHHIISLGRFTRKLHRNNKNPTSSSGK